MNHRVIRLFGQQATRGCQCAVKRTRFQVGQYQHEVGTGDLCVQRRGLFQLCQPLLGVAARHLANAQRNKAGDGGRLAS